ncbi:MAG: glycosyl hydrolase family 28-related protein [Opitutales bacterium]
MKSPLIHSLSILFVLFAGHLHANDNGGKSIYPDKIEDSKAYYLTPENFGVAADGIQDDAPAIQAAIDKAGLSEGRRIIFVPEGTYRLGGTLRLWKGVRLIGYGKNRPVFKLTDNTPGFQEGEMKYMLQFAKQPREKGRGPRENGLYTYADVRDGDMGTFYGGIKNIDFEIGARNPAAIAIRFRAAQNTMLQDMHFRIGSGLGAVENMSHLIERCTFSGGEWAIFTRGSPPGWQNSILDCTFENQRNSSVITNNGRIILIRGKFKGSPVGVTIPSTDKLFVKDCWFEDMSKSAFLMHRYAAPQHQINIQNAKFSNVPYSLKFEIDQRELAGEDVVLSYQAPSDIFEIEDFSHGIHINMRLEDDPEITFNTRMEQSPIDRLGVFPEMDVPYLPPSSTWIDITTLGAVGDGKTDCTQIIQDAIKQHDTLYFPLGVYRVSSTIELGENTTLISLHPDDTRIHINTGEPFFSDFDNPQPVFQTQKGSRVGISGFGMSPGVNPGIIGFMWNAGPGSYFDDVRFGGHGKDTPGGNNRKGSVWIYDEGTAVVKNFWIHIGRSRKPFHIKDTKIPGTFYQVSIEHHYDWELTVENSANWNFYGLQTESNIGCENATAVHVINSENLFFANYVSHRTTGVWEPSKTAFNLVNSKDITIRGTEVRGGAFSFDNLVTDDGSGASVPYHLVARFEME